MKELIHFSATWCQPCKQMQPMLDKFINDNPDIIYTKYDAERNPSMFTEYQVRSVPTIITKIDNEIVQIHVGIANQDKLETMFS